MGYLSILLFLAIGTILTVVVQSSSATMALTLVRRFEGWIPFDLAAVISNYHAKRTARAHLVFNFMVSLGC